MTCHETSISFTGHSNDHPHAAAHREALLQEFLHVIEKQVRGEAETIKPGQYLTVAVETIDEPA